MLTRRSLLLECSVEYPVARSCLVWERAFNFGYWRVFLWFCGRLCAIKYCPKCRSSYPTETDFCLIDGTPLVLNDPEAKTFKIEPESETVPLLEVIQTKERLALGDYFDLHTKYTGPIRLTIQNIKQSTFTDTLPLGIPTKETAAHIEVSTGGGLVYGGKGTTSVSTNQFLVPVKTSSHEEPRSVYFFYIAEKRIMFFRVCVDHINVHQKTVDLNMVYFRYVPQL